MKNNTVGKPKRFETHHAVVIGGSMAGLLAARVLSEHFERVTIIERDHLVDNAEPRKGVPQGRHVHTSPTCRQDECSHLSHGSDVRCSSNLSVCDLIYQRHAYVSYPGAYKDEILASHIVAT